LLLCAFFAFLFSSRSFFVIGLSFLGIVDFTPKYHSCDDLNNFPNLSVFSKRVSAFSATHKLSGRLIAASGLHLPNVHHVVIAFFALHLNRLHRRNLLILLAYDSHERLRFRLNDRPSASFSFSVCGLFSEVAFCAAKHKGVAHASLFGFQTGTTIGTKLQS